MSEIIDSHKNNVKDISPFYANAIIDKLQPKTFVAKISNGNGLINPSPINYTHGFIVSDLEQMQTNVTNSNLYSENHTISIPDLVYEYDSSRKEVNKTALIPIIVRSIKNLKDKVNNLEEDVIIILINEGEPTSEYIQIDTEKELLTYLKEIILDADPNIFKIDNKYIELLYSNILDSNITNNDVYRQIIDEKYNQNTTIQEVRITNNRKNIILQTLLIMLVQSNENIDKDDVIMIDLALLPVCPTTNVITRSSIYPLVRLISTYSIPELIKIKTTEYTITKTDNIIIIAMDIDDEIQIKYEYYDSTESEYFIKNLLHIKKKYNYLYEIKERDDNIIINKKEIVTNEVTIEYDNKTFTYYYVLGSFAATGGEDENTISS